MEERKRWVGRLQGRGRVNKKKRGRERKAAVWRGVGGLADGKG